MQGLAQKPTKRARTQADADQIKELLLAGKSYSEVGAVMGATRCSIAGVCDRYSIRAETITKRPNNRVRNPRADATAPKVSKRRTQMDHVADHAASKMRAGVKAKELAPHAHGTGKSLIDLGRRCCRFATGEDAERRILFCGAVAAPGSAWCATHRALVYQPRRT